MSSFEIKINGVPVSAAPGMSILEAATMAGLRIPHLCDGMGSHKASCLLCIVRDVSTGTVIAACEHPAAPGMQIITEDNEINSLRMKSLELLLAEHGGDCIAPCALVCPAQLRVDLMVQLAEEGRRGDAAALLYAAIPLPRVSNFLCKAPCESSCRRKIEADGKALEIRTVKKYLAEQISPRIGAQAEDKSILILGGGAAALAALWHAASAGYTVTLASRSGWAGALKTQAPSLPEGLLEEEIGRLVTAAKAELIEHEIAEDDPICENYSAVVDCTKIHCSGTIARDFYHGRVAAEETIAVIESRPSGIQKKSSPSRLSNPDTATLAVFEENRRIIAENTGELTPIGGKLCLRCGCESAQNCRLKQIADELKFKAGHCETVLNDDFLQIERHGDLIYSPAKCVRCALCITEAQKLDPRPHLDFCGRGGATRLIFDPLNPPLKESAQALAEVCPTAALVYSKTKEAVQ